MHPEKQLSEKEHWNARTVWSEVGLLVPRALPVQSSVLEYAPSGFGECGTRAPINPHTPLRKACTDMPEVRHTLGTWRKSVI